MEKRPRATIFPRVAIFITPMHQTRPGGPGPRWGTRLAFIISGFVLGIWVRRCPVCEIASWRQRQSRSVSSFFAWVWDQSCSCLSPDWWPADVEADRSSSVPPPSLRPFCRFWRSAHSQIALGAGLFVLGASIGSLDVAMNAHAIEVEQAAGRPLMSGFHACYSIGGFAGAGAAATLYSLGASTVTVMSANIADNPFSRDCDGTTFAANPRRKVGNTVPLAEGCRSLADGACGSSLSQPKVPS